MENTIEKVKRFHELAGAHVRTAKDKIPLEIRKLRIKLLFEELSELSVASDVEIDFAVLCQNYIDNFTDEKTQDDENKVEMLDALVDIQYVLLGAVLDFGMDKIFDEGFNLIHQNNMRKGHLNYEEAIITADKYNLTKDNIKLIYGKYVVFNLDGKLVKPYNHERVNLENLIK